MNDYKQMPQQRQNMQMSGEHEHHEKSGKSFHELMDCVASELYHGLTWHGVAAPQMYKIGLRGYAHLHTYNAAHDFEKLFGMKTGEGGLLKILEDRLDYCPDIDSSDIQQTLKFKLSSPADLKPHFEAWCNSEHEFSKYLTESVRMAASVDMCVYHELACILSAVQEEIMRINILKKRMEIGGYAGHDLATISRHLHIHFESHPEKGLDFDV